MVPGPLGCSSSSPTIPKSRVGSSRGHPSQHSPPSEPGGLLPSSPKPWEFATCCKKPNPTCNVHGALEANPSLQGSAGSCPPSPWGDWGPSCRSPKRRGAGRCPPTREASRMGMRMIHQYAMFSFSAQHLPGGTQRERHRHVVPGGDAGWGPERATPRPGGSGTHSSLCPSPHPTTGG